MKLKILIFTILCVTGFSLIRGKKELLDEFYIRKIVSDYDPLITVKKPTPIESILDQPYTYLGKGRQCFVFLSKDEKYVLKFVRQDRLKQPIFSKHLSFPEFLFQEKEEKRANWLDSYFLAYEKAKKITGIVYMQLGSERIKKTVSIYDRMGRKFLLPLERSEFILQKRVDLLEETLLGLRKKGMYTEIQDLFDSYLECLCERLDQGVINKTRRSIRNMGVSSERVIEFDIGEWELDSSLNSAFYYNSEIDRFTDHFEKWIAKHIPECKTYFDEKKHQRKK